MVLTYENQGLKAGDSSNYTQIQYAPPGQSGAGAIWDFSSVQYNGKVPQFRIEAEASLHLAGLNNYNLVSSDNGYDYFLSSDETRCMEEGYINRAKRITMVYTDPLERMKFPFAFGDRFSGTFAGYAFHNERNRIDVTGEYSVEADGWGMLILPDRVLTNVLRVKSVKRGLQTGVCGSTVTTIIRYSWYAPGYRYPVLSSSQLEQITGAEKPVITNTAFINLEQKFNAEQVAGAGTTVSQTDDQSVTVVMYPNPFQTTASFHYFLRKPVYVSMELFDITGKSVRKVLTRQQKGEGLHQGSLDAIELGLEPGIYYARFSFDRQVVVVKVVRC